jgi:hypothetical protein
MRSRWLLAALALVIACDSTVESQLESQLWKELDIQNYQFQYTVSCFCGFTGPNPALITVRAGQVTKVEAVDSAAAGPVPGPPRTWPTVDSLFAVVERARLTNPAVLKVDYDETYHYPKSIYIDQADKVADDEVTYKVDHFTLLSPSK